MKVVDIAASLASTGGLCTRSKHCVVSLEASRRGRMMDGKICTHRRPFGPKQGWGHEGAHQTALHIKQVHLHRRQGAQGQDPSHIQVTPAHWGNQDRSRKTQQFLWEGVRFWSKEIWATKLPWHQLFDYYWGCVLEPISNAKSQPSMEFLKASILAAWPPHQTAVDEQGNGQVQVQVAGHHAGWWRIYSVNMCQHPMWTKPKSLIAIHKGLNWLQALNYYMVILSPGFR